MRSVRAGALSLGLRLIRALPDALVYRAAFATGVALSYLLRQRRSLVRDNLRQVCRGLVEVDLATDRVRRAATDEGALDRMTRSAFGNWVQSYAESAIVTGYSTEELRRRLSVPVTDASTAALAPQVTGERGRIYVGLHFGCVELPAAYATAVAGMCVLAPMETVLDPQLQRYFESTRGAAGIELIPIRGAAARLREALATGASAALVADRAIGGAGIAVDLFGAPARLPLGPAVLALETGAPVYVVGVRRTGWGRWSARIERLAAVSGTTLRERIHAHMAAQAREFERIVADAPEQWWTCFFPIWQQPAVPSETAIAEAGA